MKIIQLIAVWFSFVLCLCLSGQLRAVEVERLFEVEVEVADQSATERWKATLAGFKEILVRRSGTEDVLSAHQVNKAYAKVTAYLQRFEYIANTDEAATTAYKLALHFEPRAIDQLIQDAGMPIWGSNRPMTMLWLVLEEGYSRTIIKDKGDAKEAVEYLHQQARRRGLPIALPLMDLEDQLNVTTSDVWGRFNSPVKIASERYAADSIILGRISKTGNDWRAKVSYVNEEEENQIEVSEADKASLYAGLINRLAEVLCRKYCVVEQAETSELSVQVSNINNFTDFNALENYLESLSSVRKVELSRISQRVVRLKVSLLGDLPSFEEGVRLGQKLINEEAPMFDPFIGTAKAELQSSVQDSLYSEKIPNQDNGNQLTNEDLLSESASGDDAPQSEKLDPILPVEQPLVIYYRWQG